MKILLVLSVVLAVALAAPAYDDSFEVDSDDVVFRSADGVWRSYDLDDDDDIAFVPGVATTYGANPFFRSAANFITYRADDDDDDDDDDIQVIYTSFVPQLPQPQLTVHYTAPVVTANLQNTVDVQTYNAPRTTSFLHAYSEPAVQTYHAPAVQVYSDPAVQTYSGPTVHTYSAPAVQTYSAPAVQTYSAPAVQTYSAPAVQAYSATNYQTYSAPTTFSVKAAAPSFYSSSFSRPLFYSSSYQPELRNYVSAPVPSVVPRSYYVVLDDDDDDRFDFD